MAVEAKVVLGVVAFLILFYGSIVLYFKRDIFKSFYHDMLGWHRPDYTIGVWDDGISYCSRCKHCGKRILQDSQGNWFVSCEDGGAE